MKLLKVERLHNDKKKYIAFFETDDGKIKHTKFGASGYQDFTTHRDITRKNSYISRHSKDLETHDPTKPGFLSMYLLWNKPTLKESIQDYKKKFNL